MHVLNIVASPRKGASAFIAVVDAFLAEYRKRQQVLTVDRLGVWGERLPEFDCEAIGARYKGVSGAPMSPSKTSTWETIKALAAHFQRAG